MATTISTNGRKKLKTLQDDFNDKFSHLKIEFSSKPSVDDRGESIHLRAKDKLDNSKTLSEVRKKTGDGKISINGRKRLKRSRKNFRMFSVCLFKYIDGLNLVPVKKFGLNHLLPTTGL